MNVIEWIEKEINLMMKQYEIMITWKDNEIGDSGAKKISESLMKNTTLTTLDLRSVIDEW